MHRLRESRSWLPALGVGLLSVALGAATLGRKSLWYDEAFDAVHVRNSWEHLGRLIRNTEMSQGAYLVGLKIWAAATPDSEVWLRAPAVVAAALAAALLVPLGTRLFDRTTGTLAGVFLATNAFVVQHAQEVRTYAIVILAVVVASLAFVYALDNPRRRNWLLYAIAAAIAVYCHFYAGFVIVAHMASLPLAPSRPPLRRVIEAAIVFIVLIVPALYFVVHGSRVGLQWIADPSPRFVADSLKTVVGKNGVLALAAAVGLGLLAYRTAMGTSRDRWRLALIGFWCLLPVVLGVLVSQIQNILTPQYLLVIAPALALAAAVPIAAALHGGRVPAAVGVAAIVALVAISGYRIARWYDEPREDWRSAAAYVAREARAGDAVVVTPYFSRIAYSYYDPDRPIEQIARRHRTLIVFYGGSEAEHLASSREITGGTTGHIGPEKPFGGGLAVGIYEPAP